MLYNTRVSETLGWRGIWQKKVFPGLRQLYIKSADCSNYFHSNLKSRAWAERRPCKVGRQRRIAVHPRGLDTFASRSTLRTGVAGSVPREPAGRAPLWTIRILVVHTSTGVKLEPDHLFQYHHVLSVITRGSKNPRRSREADSGSPSIESDLVSGSLQC